MSDRTIHAETSTFQVVRYDRAGQWYVERPADGYREHVGVVEAARRAFSAQAQGGSVYLGRPGGAVFDRWFQVEASGE